MAKEKFEFSPRVELIMANLKTVRELREVIIEEGENNIKKFLNYIRDELNDGLPELQSWKCEFYTDKHYTSINYYFGNHWKVLKDDYICIYIEMPYDNELLDHNDDPTVGLYVPEPKIWRLSNKFTKNLNEKLPKSFMNYWEEPDNDSPIFQYVNIEDYAKGESFDTNGFVDKVEELVSNLVEKKDIIDTTIKQVKR